MAVSQTLTRPADVVDTTYRYRWLVLIGLMTAAVMEVLDTTIINVALPQMAGNLGATSTEVAWVSTGYILSNVVVLPMTAFLTGVFGRRNYLAFSIIVFIIASFLCGISHSLIELVIWRVLQGAGGAALLSTAQATIRQIFPREQQALVQAVFLLGIIVAPTIGPTLGGWITDNYNWGWCFFINVPIGIVSFFLVTTFLIDPPGMRTGPGKVDWLGIGLLAVGLSSLQYVLEEGNQDDWFQDATIVKLTIIAIVSLAGMLWWELSPRNKAPVVDFRILKNRSLSASIVLFIALGFGLYGGIYIFPLFTQSILGFTPTETGLALLPGGLATAVTAMICGRILGNPKSKLDARVLIFIGVGLFVVAMWDLGHLTTAAGLDDTRVALIIRGLALGFLFAPINNVAFGSVEPREAQQAAGLINLSRQLGGSFGIAVLGTFLANRTHLHRAQLVEVTYPGNPAFEARLSSATAAFQARGFDPERARLAAHAAIDGAIQKQGAMLAYNDAWMLILVAFVIASPAVLILRRPKGAGGPAVDAH